MLKIVSFVSVVTLSAVACHTPVKLDVSPPRSMPPAAPVAPAASQTTQTAGNAPELGSFGVALEHRDLSVEPGDDFYRYVNGKWLDEYQLAPDEMRYGAFVKLRYLSEDRVHAIVEEMRKKSPPQGSVQQQVGDYYQSFMAVETLEKKGIAPLRDELAALDAIDSYDDLFDAFGRSTRSETKAPIAVALSIDRMNPDRHELNVVHDGLGLPERSYYLEESFAAIVEGYKKNIATMLGFAGVPDGQDAEKIASQIVALETQIAQHHWPRAELRDRDKTNNKATLAELQKQYPAYPWQRHLQAAGYDLSKVGQLNVYTPSAVAPLAALVKKTPLATWKQYLRYHLVAQHASLLGDTIYAANFAFWGKVLSGQPEPRERWRRAVNLVGDMEGLGEALGKIYVERHFSAAAREQMDALVENLRAAFKERIEQAEWMGQETKKAALHKLSTFNPKIGAPKKWRDFSSIQITSDDLMANYRAVREYWYADMLSRVGKPTDKDEWAMTPQTVNAYYNPSFNEIVFPAAILQPPFFDPNADPAVNYGSIGAVIGHEMGHGFDDQGSKSDAGGIQRNWWTDEDRARFDTRTKALAEQYDQYEPIPGHKVNGKLTLGENIGDLGGLSVAYQAYKKFLAGKEAPVIDGHTGDQRFFLGYGQVWASKARDEYIIRKLTADPHSPGEYRVNGVVPNMDAWYEAFDVKPDDELYVAPEKRIRIW